MTFTVVFPIFTAGGTPPTGIGSIVRVRTNQVFHIGDHVVADLVVNAGTGFAGTAPLAQAIGIVGGTSQLTDLFWGWDAVGGRPVQALSADPYAAFLSTFTPTCDVHWKYYDVSNTVIDSQTDLNLFVWDPLSQGAQQALLRLWDQAASNLQQVIGRLQFLAPGTPAYRTPHVGLSGPGVLGEFGAAGVRVVATTIPTRWGKTADSPPRYIPAYASIQFQDFSEFPDRHLIHYDHQLVVADPLESSAINYNIQPGWVATITAFDGT